MKNWTTTNYESPVQGKIVSCAGDGRTYPLELDTVKISMGMKPCVSPFVPVYFSEAHERETRSFTMNVDSVMPGLIERLKTMSQHEVATFMVPPDWAYQHGSWLCLTVELLDVMPPWSRRRAADERDSTSTVALCLIRENELGSFRIYAEEGSTAHVYYCVFHANSLIYRTDDQFPHALTLFGAPLKLEFFQMLLEIPLGVEYNVILDSEKSLHHKVLAPALRLRYTLTIVDITRQPIGQEGPAMRSGTTGNGGHIQTELPSPVRREQSATTASSERFVSEVPRSSKCSMTLEPADSFPEMPCPIFCERSLSPTRMAAEGNPLYTESRTVYHDRSEYHSRKPRGPDRLELENQYPNGMASDLDNRRRPKKYDSWRQRAGGQERPPSEYPSSSDLLSQESSQDDLPFPSTPPVREYRNRMPRKIKQYSGKCPQLPKTYQLDPRTKKSRTPESGTASHEFPCHYHYGKAPFRGDCRSPWFSEESFQ